MKLIWKNIYNRPLQSAITSIIVAIVVFIIVSIACTFQTINKGLEISEDRLGADIIILPGKGNEIANETLFTGLPQNVYMDEKLIGSIKNVEGIDKLTPQFFTQTLDEGCCSIGAEIRIVGYDMDSDFIVSPWIKEKENQVIKENEIVCGNKVPYTLGKSAIILGNKFKVAGNLNETGSGMDNTIFIDIDTARNIAKNSEKLKGYFYNEDPFSAISSIMIKILPSYNSHEVINRINELNLDITATAVGSVISSTRENLQAINKIVIGLLGAIILLAVITLFGRFDFLIRNKRREIGLMRTLGRNKLNIFLIIILEALTLVSIGGIVGSSFGFIFSKLLLEYIQTLLGISVGTWTINLGIQAVLYGIGFALVLGVIASIYPCWKAANMEPMMAILKGDID